MAFLRNDNDEDSKLRQLLEMYRPWLPELNFITIHYACFVFTSLFAAIIFWGSSTPSKSVTFTDALFLTISASTNTGLNTVNLSEINTWQQIILMLLMIAGSAIVVSAVIVFVRLRAFENAFVDLKKKRDERRLKRRNTGHWFMPRKLTRSRPLEEVKRQSVAATANGHAKMPPIFETRIEREASDPDLGGFSYVQDGNDRGRTLRPTTSRTQCPSQSPGAREEDHEDCTEPVALTAKRSVGFADDTNFSPIRQRTMTEPYRPNRSFLSFTGVGATARSSLRPRPSATTPTSIQQFSAPPNTPFLARAPTLTGAYDQRLANDLTENGWISRNSQFHGLTMEERQKLGGREYAAVVFLSFLVPLYAIMWQFLGCLALGAYVNNNRAATARENGQIPWFVGAFNAVSAFNNGGLSLLDANMIAFQTSIFMLISMSLFILAGNTGFPIFMRLIVWTGWKFTPDNQDWSETRQTLRFLLDHPRRVYTSMFPSRHTWWLTASLVVLNVVDWFFFEVLSVGAWIGDQDIESLPATTRVLGGLFQAFSVRSGGFYVVPIPTLRISLQFLYVIMMYISVYPVTMTMRNSNVYEERSLGIFAEDVEDPDRDITGGAFAEKDAHFDPMTPGGSRFAGLKRRMTGFAEKAAPAPRRETRSYFVRQQLRAQLAHDIWFAVLAIFLVLIIESGQMEANPISHSAFNVIFEVISAYSTVGMSVGVPDNAYSFSGSWHGLSKLVLMAVMLRGRHRGLPVAIDHAIQLPGQRLWDAEDEDGERRIERIERNLSMATARTPGPEQGPTSASPASPDLCKDFVLKSPTALHEAKRGARERAKADGQHHGHFSHLHRHQTGSSSFGERLPEATTEEKL